MTWKDIGVVLVPLIVGLTPIYMWWFNQIKERKKAKKADKILDAELNLENFNTILEANKKLREELEKERKNLKFELEKERATVKELANRVITLSNKLEELQRFIRNVLGLKDMVNIQTIKISVLEDSDNDTELLRRCLEKNGIDNVKYYSNEKDFIAGLDIDTKILIIDQGLTYSSGIDVIKQVIELNEFRFFIMLSGMEDFNVIYTFNRIVTHGTYILKGRPETEGLVLKSIRNTVHYLNILSESYKEIKV